MPSQIHLFLEWLCAFSNYEIVKLEGKLGEIRKRIISAGERPEIVREYNLWRSRQPRESLEEDIAAAKERCDWPEVSRLETIRQMRDEQED